MKENDEQQSKSVPQTILTGPIRTLEPLMSLAQPHVSSGTTAIAIVSAGSSAMGGAFAGAALGGVAGAVL